VGKLAKRSASREERDDEDGGGDREVRRDERVERRRRQRRDEQHHEREHEQREQGVAGPPQPRQRGVEELQGQAEVEARRGGRLHGVTSWAAGGSSA